MLIHKKTNLVMTAVFLGILASSGCSKGDRLSKDPKDRLTQYISISFSIHDLSDRQKLLGFLTGETKTRLSAWSNDQFREAFIESKRKFIKLAFKEIKKISPTEIGITYEISYIDPARGTEAKVTTKKLAQMTLENGDWFIRDVTNIKELVEFQKEMSLP